MKLAGRRFGHIFHAGPYVLHIAHVHCAGRCVPCRILPRLITSCGPSAMLGTRVPLNLRIECGTSSTRPVSTGFNAGNVRPRNGRAAQYQVHETSTKCQRR